MNNIYYALFCLNRKFLVANLVSRSLKVKYRRSGLGILWTVAAPMATATMFYLIFSFILKVQREDYLIYVVSGILLWTFFSQTVTEGITHYVDMQNLITKIYLPLNCFNLSTSVVNLVSLIASLPVIIFVSYLSGHSINGLYLLIPFYLSTLFLMAYFSSIIVSALYVFFRDSRQLVTLGLQFLFYGTPVLYSVEMIPEKFRFVVSLNPLGVILPAFQNVFTNKLKLDVWSVSQPLIWVLLLGFIAYLIVTKLRKSIVENL